jgi:hypothetical protein
MVQHASGSTPAGMRAGLGREEQGELDFKKTPVQLGSLGP